ncbi:deoxynucleoside kinase [Cryomorpha ignava]|uniref:Deoxynucleoside kinase n=1 Tax=Cryomorpha ignava TaxID=101383 RepID=A0A7K3WQS1_9FLAO|nr:deoxynucleoside kinase [Cryomorpha ignava]NEN24020.1 deoxynucleoside kinase [Cryomorpha ignava]
MLKNYNYISIEGTIGAGKTTLAKMLAKHYDAKLVLEQFENNEFLPKFYSDPERYAFTVELSFLAERYQQIKKHELGPNLFNDLTVADYFLSKSLVFASSNLKEDEYKLFREVFDIMFHSVPKPDLLVYLYVPVEKLLTNIRKRGRRYEQNISYDYLQLIQNQYLEFLRKYADQLKVLILDVSELDFVKNEQDFNSIVEIIEKPISKGLHREMV